MQWAKVNHCATLRHFDVSPCFQWRKKDEKIAGAVALVFIIIFGHVTRSGRQWQTSFLGQLFAALVLKEKSGRFGS